MRYTRLKKSYILFLIIIFATGFFAKIHAQESYNASQLTIEGQTLEPNVSEPSITIEDPFSLPMILKKRLEKCELYINFNFGETYLLGSTYDNTATITLSLKDDNNNLLETKEFNLSDENPEQLWVYDFIDNPTVTAFNIVVENPLVVGGGFSDLSVIQSYVKLDVSYVKEYAIDVNDETTNTAQTVTLNEPTRNSSVSNKTVGRVQNLQWTRQESTPFPAYQIQILKLYNNDPLNEVENTITANIDWSKALTIETESNDGNSQNFWVSISEGNGFYVWRVRPIGNYYKGGVTNPLNWGKWSTAPADNEPETISLYDLNVAHPQYFFLIDQDDDKNWIYSRTFTEGNKIHEQVVYANGLQQAKQTQVRLSFDDDYKLVSQSILDYSGRPAMVTIPVPVDEQGDYNKGYVKKLVENADNLYTADEYDKDENYNKPSTVDSGSDDKYSYYSQTNIDKQIPDAEGYPYSRTLYYNDGTGRVKEQFSPGKAFNNVDNAGTMEYGHTVKTLYATPAPEELLRIFGNEAPDENKVLKVTTIDQNGIASISYIGENGKVIATCISESLDEEPDPALNSNFNIEQTAAHNIESNNQLISSQRISLSQTLDLEIVYDINIAASESWGICFQSSPSCGFSAKIIVIDLSNNTQVETFELSNADLVSGTVSRTVYNLPAGNYLVIKELSHNIGDIAEAARISADQAEAQIRPVVDLVSGWIQSDYDPDNFGPFNTLITSYHNDYIAAAENYASFNTTYGFAADYTPTDVTLYPEYVENPLTIPTTLILESCCGPVEISLENNKTSKFECIPIADLTSPEQVADFSEYLQNVIIQHNISQPLVPLQWSDLMGNYNEEVIGENYSEFDQMIYHMLTDEYSIGVNADGTTPDACIHYTCEQLWKCWISTVDMLEDMLALETNNGTMASATDTDDDEEQEEGEDLETHDETFDNHTEGFGGWLMNWIAQKALSKRMRDDFPAMEPYELNLAENFLECAGYKLRMNDVLSGDTYNPEPVIFSNLEDPPVTKVLYLYDPIYAFKYFTYLERSSPGCERTYCYIGPTTDELNTLGKELCEDDPCLDMDYTKWDSTQILDFYQCIKNEVILNEPEPETLDDDVTDIFTCTDLLANAGTEQETPQLTMIKAQRAALISECNATCDGKRSQYVTALYDLFEASCYTINPSCTSATDDNIVTADDIGVLADTLVGRCKTYCPVENSEFDYCDDLSLCVRFNYEDYENEQNRYIEYGNGIMQDIVIRILTDCESLEKQMVETWEFDLSIPSKCENLDENGDPVLNGDGLPQPIPDPEWILASEPTCVDGVPQDEEDTDSDVITNTITMPATTPPEE